MVSRHQFNCFCTLVLILLIESAHCQQFYDKSGCRTGSQVPGSNYLCSSKLLSCETFIVYRAQENFHSLSNISSLFQLNLYKLLDINKMTEADATSIALGREIIIPVSCNCTAGFSRAIFMYNLSSSDSFPDVACGVFEGLVKPQSLVKENSEGSDDDPTIKVPIRCACPNENDTINDINYLVTYPVVENDNTDLIARKFGVLEETIWAANRLQSFDSIFPETTLLIPTNDVPDVDWDETLSIDPASSPRGVIPLTKVTSSAETATILKPQVFLAVGVITAVVSIFAACCICLCIRAKNHSRSFPPFSATSSMASNLTPDFLDGVSKLKHSLISFTMEELRIATEDFNETSVIGPGVYRGRIGSSCVAIERMDSEEEVRHVIGILTKINHLNVVRLEGCCYDGNTPYLAFEYAENGSLRDSLSNVKMSKQLTWAQRMQIAFDLAVAIHYIHHCTQPAYVHGNINSRNVLITMDWRAKISGFRSAKAVIFKEEKEQMNWNIESVAEGREGRLAPECLSDGLASFKVDVFAYGVVLLELLSAEEVAVEGKLLKDCLKFLVDAEFGSSSSGFLDKFTEFLDPALEGDYQLGDAMCLAFLAKACIQENPHHRPTMNDVLKALSRIV